MRSLSTVAKHEASSALRPLIAYPVFKATNCLSRRISDPKVDIHVVDSASRNWTLIQVQVPALAVSRLTALSYPDLHGEDDASAAVVACWLCGRLTGKTSVWHHPVPKSRGGRDVVPRRAICQQTVMANFTNSELQRHGTDMETLPANLNVRKFVDRVTKKEPDFTASTAKKQR